MPQIQLQCRHCGGRQEIYLNEVELADLRDRGSLSRYCLRCAGTTSWVAASPRAAALVTSAGPEEKPAGRILVIDDDESVQSIIRHVLSQGNFKLEFASTGRGALQMLARGDYDLILSDIRMPELDGREFFKFLSDNMPEYKQRVIFLTGDTGNPATMDFLAETDCPYLTKPLEIPVFLQMLEHFFSS